MPLIHSPILQPHLSTSSPLQTSSSATCEWHFVSKDEEASISDDVEVVLRGCDAIITTLDTDITGNIHSGRWIRSFHTSSTEQLEMLQQQQDNDVPIKLQSPPTEAILAMEATHRWSSNFVRTLHLCPWAGNSLDTPGAIRFWMLLVDVDDMDSKAMEGFESVVREAGRHLQQITTNIDGSDLDAIEASAAISFVILVPTSSFSSASDNNLPFGIFHEFFVDLEDRLLDECDDYFDSIGDEIDQKTNDNNEPVGCQVTIAAFHPQWQFGSDDNESETQSIDYEKRTPFPTISIVMTSAIDALMDQSANRQQESNEEDDDEASSAPVTDRIAVLNEKTLCAMGVEKLKNIFDKEVLLRCPLDE